eukprot:CAMPEP_0119312062 /NCGR_PEP_ID=MMETSP1333-20130426/24908_1 /TAXON_ID=418940 /ORGANISM="Scyphosphaera apsteinii, Strain RCC1455" /LENGTH=190 /DNA_ID=CAMNT_0007316611 /DNA_START=117 /DNA_END=686 /DNA_ORIENTATION=+
MAAAMLSLVDSAAPHDRPRAQSHEEQTLLRSPPLAPPLPGLPQPTRPSSQDLMSQVELHNGSKFKFMVAGLLLAVAIVVIYHDRCEIVRIWCWSASAVVIGIVMMCTHRPGCSEDLNNSDVKPPSKPLHLSRLSIARESDPIAAGGRHCSEDDSDDSFTTAISEHSQLQKCYAVKPVSILFTCAGCGWWT